MDSEVRSRRRRSFLQGAVEKLDDVKDILIGVMKGGAGAELKDAARVRGHDGLRASGLSVAHFFGEQFQRRFGLRDVVGSRRAAADFRVRQFHEIEIWDRAQELARSFADFLPVQQMAGILIRDAMAHRIEFCS